MNYSNQYPTRIEKDYELYLYSEVDNIFKEAIPLIKNETFLSSFKDSEKETKVREFATLVYNFLFVNLNKKLTKLKRAILPETGGQRLPQGIKPLYIENWIVENVEYITSLRKIAYENISNQIQTFYNEGKSTAELSSTIEKELRESANPDSFNNSDTQNAVFKTKRRARLIADDQMGGLIGQITKEQHSQANITRYIWRTLQDPNVRKSHQEKNGETFSWSEVGEYPGSAIRCRCFADPII